MKNNATLQANVKKEKVSNCRSNYLTTRLAFTVLAL